MGLGRVLLPQQQGGLSSEQGSCFPRLWRCSALACCTRGRDGGGRRRRSPPRRGGPGGGPGHLQVAPRAQARGREVQEQGCRAKARRGGRTRWHLRGRQPPEATPPQAGALAPQRGLSPRKGLLQDPRGCSGPRDTPGTLGSSDGPLLWGGPSGSSSPRPLSSPHLQVLLCPPVGGSPSSIPPRPSPAAVQAGRAGRERPSAASQAPTALTQAAHAPPPRSLLPWVLSWGGEGPALGGTRWVGLSSHRKRHSHVPPSPGPGTPGEGLAWDGLSSPRRASSVPVGSRGGALSEEALAVCVRGERQPVPWVRPAGGGAAAWGEARAGETGPGDR